MKKAIAMGLVAIFLASLFGAGYGLAAESLPRNETLYTANSAPPTNANPFTGGSVLGIDGLVFEPLFMFNFMTGELKPWLAESAKWVGDNVFEVKLRSGLKWQDGKPLTAEDVKFSYEYYEKIGLRNWGNLGLKEIKVVDDRTVQFIFEGTPNYQLWQLQMFFGWGQGALIVPKHVFENINPEDIPKMTFTGDEMKYLVGSGAYKLKEIVGQEKAILERNDDWWGVKVFGKPGPKYIVQLYVTDNNQAANMFIKGDLDVGTYYIDIVSAKQKNPKLASWLDKYPYFPPVAPVLLYFNTKHAPLDNPKVRRAIAMAINPYQIVNQGPISDLPKQVPFGPGLLTKWSDKVGIDGLISQYGWKYGDVAGAIKLLDEAGIKDTDGDGIREYNGKPLKLKFVTCAGCNDWLQAGEIIANQLKAVGIEVEIEKGDWTNFFMKSLQNGDFDLALHWSGTFQPSAYAVFNMLISKDGGANYGKYENPQVDQILQEFGKTVDENKEAQYIKQLCQIWLQDVPAVPVYMATLFYEANTEYWTNWPNEKNPYGVPIFWTNYGTWGTALALLGVKPAKAPASETTTTSSAPATTSSSGPSTSSSSESPASSTSSGGGGICGPAAVVLLAAVPLLMRRRR